MKETKAMLEVDAVMVIVTGRAGNANNKESSKSVLSAECGDGLPPAFLRVVGTHPDVPPHTQCYESRARSLLSSILWE